MDLNKSAGSPKSTDAKTEGGPASSPPANIKAENPSAADAEIPVAPPRKAAGSPKKDSVVVPEGIPPTGILLPLYPGTKGCRWSREERTANRPGGMEWAYLPEYLQEPA